jgi:hypothetical protein
MRRIAVKVLSLFPSRYLKAADLQDVTHDVTIDRVEVGTVGEGGDEQERPILFFVEIGKGLCLNVTNAKRIIKLYGDDSDTWAGKRITIYPSECDYKGETVPCIRVKPHAPAARVPLAKEPPSALKRKAKAK